MSTAREKIAIGSDHRGYHLKEAIKSILKSMGVQFEDVGTRSENPVDYPEFAKKVASRVSGHSCSKGILICGSGIGMSVVASQ
jgi:ribose 5-phosphate isomerase B